MGNTNINLKKGAQYTEQLKQENAQLKKEIEKLQKERQLVKSIIQSAYNGGQTYCILPNGKECRGDMGYVIEFYIETCKYYPELRDIFGEEGE